MLVTDRIYKGFKWRHIAFVEERFPELEKKIDFINYSIYSDAVGGGLTLMSNLTSEEEDIFSQITKNTKYEINRARKEGVKCFQFDSSISKEQLHEIIRFYNKFVDTKEELHFKLTYKYIKPYIDNKSFYCSCAYDGEKIVVIHIYYGDTKTVRLWYSASHFRNEDDNQKKNYIGRANRYLHWMDMLYFKKIGYERYDWGGYNEYNLAVRSISDFKKQFGGECQGLIVLVQPVSFIGKLAWEMRKRLKNIW